MKKPALIEIPVLLLFFNRPDPLNRVFEEIRKARPTKLFLVQDGARENNAQDKINIQRCRAIVSEIDWECEVLTNYSDKNLSCDHREFTGISWAFEHVDKLIILEDDCVPAQSFFPFCKELLERYGDDQRIHMISGTSYRLEGQAENESYSYFFSQAACGWGWATWRRVWMQAEQQRDFEYLKDENTYELMKGLMRTVAPKSCRASVALTEQKRSINRATGKVSSWESAIGITMFLQSQLVITPQSNLICNVGVTYDSTHSVDDLRKLSKGIQRVFQMKTHEMEFPLKHPEYVIRDVAYEQMVGRISHPGWLAGSYRRVETFLRKNLYTKKSDRKALYTHYFHRLKTILLQAVAVIRRAIGQRVMHDVRK